MFSRKPEPQGTAPTASPELPQPVAPAPQAAPVQPQAVSPERPTAPAAGLAAPQQQPVPTNTQTARTTTMAPTVIGPDFKITGHAVSNGEVQVDGEIEGDIECQNLTVGQSAKVTGNVIAETVTVQGKVMGSIRGSNVTLQASSHIEGDVYHQQLAIEQGAFFEGKSRRSENPVAEAPKPSDRAASSSSNGSLLGSNGKDTSSTTSLIAGS